jgi:hypothetical protein
MLTGINLALVTAIATVNTVYLLRRRTRLLPNNCALLRWVRSRRANAPDARLDLTGWPAPSPKPRSSPC